jgi:hypothetical protein
VSYRPDRDGLRDLGQSPGMSAAMLEAAERLAGNANAVGESTYEAARTTVTAGWANERRSGAVVRESERDWRDSRDRVLLRVRDAMGVRGRQ